MMANKIFQTQSFDRLESRSARAMQPKELGRRAQGLEDVADSLSPSVSNHFSRHQFMQHQVRNATMAQVNLRNQEFYSQQAELNQGLMPTMPSADHFSSPVRAQDGIAVTQTNDVLATGIFSQSTQQYFPESAVRSRHFQQSPHALNLGPKFNPIMGMGTKPNFEVEAPVLDVGQFDEE